MERRFDGKAALVIEASIGGFGFTVHDQVKNAGRPDDWWSEDWVGSCTRASNNDPHGRRRT